MSPTVALEEPLVATRRRRLRELIDTKFAGNTSSLGKAIGKKPQQLTDMLAGRKAFGEKVARGIEKALDGTPWAVHSGWLDDRRAPALGRSQVSGLPKSTAESHVSDTKGDNVEPGPDVRPRGIPVISWVRAGAFCEAIDNFQPGDAEDWIPTVQGHGPRAYALRVRGDSMLGQAGDPSFAEGDIILVEPDRDPRHRDLVIARLPGDNEVTFKRLLMDGERRYLQALNPSWPNRVVELPRDALICGVVFGRWTAF